MRSKTRFYYGIFKNIQGVFKSGNLKDNKLVIEVKRKHRILKELVAEAFVTNPYPERYTMVNCIDGDNCNLHYSNLEWYTNKKTIGKHSLCKKVV